MNIIKLNLIIFLVITSLQISAQDFEVDFRARGNVNEVRMLWKPVKWTVGLEGFNVKRKTGANGTWQTLNESVIIPSTDDIQLVTNDRATVERLIQKRDSLIPLRKMRRLSAEEMRDVFLLDQEAIRFMGFFAVQEFDHGLIYGFGYYDQNIPEADQYTYGLFPVVNGQETADPYDTYTWQYGSTPDLELNYTTEIRQLKKKKGIEVLWTASTSLALDKQIKGFHVYKEDPSGNVTRVTKDILRINLGQEDLPVMYSDKEYDHSEEATFFVTPIDDFDYVGPKNEQDYNPSTYVPLGAPALQLDAGLNTEESITLNWTFPENYESRISGFSVYRRNSLAEEPELIYEAVAAERSFEDKGIDKPGAYFYTVNSVLFDGFVFEGKERSIYKEFKTDFSAPSAFKATLKGNGSDRYVQLDWAPKPASDTITAGYQIFVERNNTGLAYLGSIPLVTSNTYRYPVKGTYGKRYRFAIRAVDNDNAKSDMTDTLTVYAPSLKMPEFSIWPVAQNGNVVTLNWSYSQNIDDLEGFNLYQNGVLISTPEQLNADARQWVSPPLQPGKYVYEMEAVSRFSVKSGKSTKRSFNIE